MQVLPVDALRLVMLYALRYERSRNNNVRAACFCFVFV